MGSGIPRISLLVLLLVSLLPAADVEILRDRWGVPHIYAKSHRRRVLRPGLFRRPRPPVPDRPVAAPEHGPPCRSAWSRRRSPATASRAWSATAAIGMPSGAAIRPTPNESPPNSRTASITTFERLEGARPIEFKVAGYDPGLWQPEDVTGRIAGLLMTRNLRQEVERAQDIRRLGLDDVPALSAARPVDQNRNSQGAGPRADHLRYPARLRSRHRHPALRAERSGQQQLGGGRHHDGDGKTDARQRSAPSGSASLTA